MKKILLSLLVTVIVGNSFGQTTIAILPAEVTIIGNIPPKMTSDQLNQIRNLQARNTQVAIANTMARHTTKRRNRKLKVAIITPQNRDYKSDYVISSQFQHTMIMNPRTAYMINHTAAIINGNSRANIPYVRSSLNYLNFSLIEKNTGTISDVKRGSINRSARRFFRKMRNGQLK
jgi:hypothetical protein